MQFCLNDQSDNTYMRQKNADISFLLVSSALHFLSNFIFFLSLFYILLPFAEQFCQSESLLTLIFKIFGSDLSHDTDHPEIFNTFFSIP